MYRCENFKFVFFSFLITIFIIFRGGCIVIAQPKYGQATLINSNESSRSAFIYYDNFFNDRIQIRVTPKIGKPDTLRFDFQRLTQIRVLAGMYQNALYLAPNDTIFVRYIPEGKAVFTSENRRFAELNFLGILESRNLGVGDLDLVGLSWNNNTDVNLVLDEYKSLYSKRVQLLKKFSDSLDFSSEFERVVSNEFKLMYLNGLLQPILKIPKSSKISESYLDQLDAFRNWIDDSQQLRSCFWYNYVVGGYHMYLNRNSTKEGDQFESWFYSYPKYFQEGTAGILQYNLLHDVITSPPASFQECLKVFGEGDANTELVDHLSSELMQSKRVRDSLVTTNIYLEEHLTDLNGNDILWKDVIKLNTSNVSYVDLWASWCGPCRYEMPASIILRNRTELKGVKFIYISIDNDKFKWINSVRKLKLDHADVQNYLLNPESALARFLSGDGIPKYVIIGKNGKVVSLNASRPSSYDIQGALIEALK